MTVTDLVGEIACLLAVAAVLCSRVTVPVAPVPLRSRGRIVALLGLAVTAATSTFVVAYGPDVLRIPVAIVTVVLAPGYAVVVFRRLDDVLDELVLAVAVGLALLVLVGTAMASTRLWEPLLAVALSTLVTAPALAWHATYLFLLPVAATIPAAPTPAAAAP